MPIAHAVRPEACMRGSRQAAAPTSTRRGQVDARLLGRIEDVHVVWAVRLPELAVSSQELQLVHLALAIHLAPLPHHVPAIGVRSPNRH